MSPTHANASDSAAAAPGAPAAPSGPEAAAPEASAPAPEDEAEIRRLTRETIDQLGTGIADRSLVTVLQRVQDRLGYLPSPAMLEIAAALEIPPARVYGVATFYNQFRFNPPGRRAIKVCMGTACAIKQGGTILESWERRLGISEGETTPDREYSLERVACVGCCSLAPVVLVNEDVHGHMTPTAVDGLLLQHQIAEERQRRDPAGGASSPEAPSAATPPAAGKESEA